MACGFPCFAHSQAVAESTFVRLTNRLPKENKGRCHRWRRPFVVFVSSILAVDKPGTAGGSVVQNWRRRRCAGFYPQTARAKLCGCAQPYGRAKCLISQSFLSLSTVLGGPITITILYMDSGVNNDRGAYRRKKTHPLGREWVFFGLPRERQG